MRFIYSFIIALYTGLIYIVSPFNRKAYLWVSGRKGWADKLREKFHDKGKVIWIHCASLGEFEQGRPVIEKIRGKNPEYRILVTFFSPSGYEIRKDWPFADHVGYLPADTPSNSMKFINIINPSAAIFIKYEFWNNYLTEIYRREIPLFLISGIFRSDQPFFKWYGTFFRSMLKKFTWLFVQDAESYELLSGLGMLNVTVAGDTRFDRVKKIADTTGEIAKIGQFRGKEKLFIAGSTWSQDEEIIAEYINKDPGKMKWIFAPHEIDGLNIERLEKLLRVKSVKYSEYAGDESEARVMIIDNIGLLSSAYRYAYVAAIGGGFGKGIHNILEAACWGIPVMFGPNHKKFREANELCEGKGAFSFNSFHEFAVILDKFLTDEVFYLESAKTASAYVNKNTGATDKIITEIFSKDIDSGRL